MWKQKEHAYRKIQSDIEGKKLPRVVLLYGREQFLVDWAAKLIAEKYINPAAKSMDMTILDDAELDDISISDYLISSCETLPLLSEKRVVVARANRFFSGDYGKSGGNDEKEISEYIESVPESSILIFKAEDVNLKKKIPAAISKLGGIYEFDTLSKEDLSSFAVKRFKEARIEVNTSTMSVLLDETGYFNRESDYNLYHLNNDISKMIALLSSDEKKVLTEEVVRDAIQGDIESSAIDFINYLCDGEKDRAYRLLKNILGEEGDIYRLLALMVSQFEYLLAIREMLDDKVIPSIIQTNLNLPKWRYDRLRPYAMKMKKDKLMNILAKIYGVDKSIKTGLLSGETALELIIAEV